MNTERRDPYGAALARLRRMACDGRFAWGESLVIKSLTAELRVSSTPVREALACLAGERLIERRRGHGYFFPSLTAADIIDLFDLQWTYVHAALMLHGRGWASLQKALASSPSSDDFQGVFLSIVEHTGNEALIAAHAATLDRLAAVCRTFSVLEVSFAPTAKELARFIVEGDAGALSKGVEAHHRQRCSYAGEIARSLRREGAMRI